MFVHRKAELLQDLVSSSSLRTLRKRRDWELSWLVGFISGKYCISIKSNCSDSIMYVSSFVNHRSSFLKISQSPGPICRFFEMTGGGWIDELAWPKLCGYGCIAWPDHAGMVVWLGRIMCGYGWMVYAK